MRNREELIVLMVMALFFLCVHHLSATSLDRVEDDEEIRGREMIGHLSKFGHGYAGGGRNGGHHGGVPAVSGGNDGSHSPNVQGGGGVTPLYAAAAGAGNNHPTHRGGGNRGKGGLGLQTLAIATFAWFIYILCSINQD